jgi:hypothetical protein
MESGPLLSSEASIFDHEPVARIAVERSVEVDTPGRHAKGV